MERKDYYMSFLTGPMRKHLDGHKELTNHEDVLKVEAGNLVKIPLLNGNAPCTPCVKENDLVKVGTLIGERNDHFYVPLFSSVSGKVVKIEKLMSSALKPVDHVVIENDGKYEVERPFEPLNYESATREQLVEFMKNAGIVGCGGAGFPTYVKYLKPENIDVLIINAVECEPYITADYKLMSENIDLLVLGVKALYKMSCAKACKVAIKVTKKDFIPVLEKAFANVDGVSVVAVPDVYPMGWERTLVYEITKKRYDKLPAEVGCIVSNATTAISFANALANGMPIVNKLLTVAGDGVKKNCNVSVRVGTSAKEIVDALGGYTCEDVLLIAGGPMMGRTITTDAFVIGTYNNALTILKNKDLEPLKCLRCGKCSDHCPAGLQPVRINTANKAHDLDTVAALDVMSCIECGMCTYVCPSKINVTEGIRQAKRFLALKKKK